MVSDDTTYRIEDEEGTREVTFAELVRDNAEDEDFIDELIAISPGGTARFGGGACTTTKITRLL